MSNQVFIKKIGSILGLLLACSACPSLAADPEWEQVQKTKIMRYLIEKVSWPASSIHDEINICVLDDLASVQGIKKLDGEKIKNLAVKVRQVQHEKVARENCQILYIPSSENKYNSEIIRTFYRRPVLLLADMDGFAEKGGSMNFVVVNEHVAITLNLESLKKSDLKFDLASYDSVTVVPELKDVFN